MPGDPEDLLEALAALRAENERLRVEARQSRQLLQGLEALLSLDDDRDLFANVFASLGPVFQFAQAMVLAEEGGGLTCVAADPPGLLGARWPLGALFARVVAGRVSAVFRHDEVEEWRQAPAPLQAAQPGLYMPLRIRERRALFISLRRSF